MVGFCGSPYGLYQVGLFAFVFRVDVGGNVLAVMNEMGC